MTTTPPPYGTQPAAGAGKPSFLKRKGVQIAGAGIIGLIVGGAAGGGSAQSATTDKGKVTALQSQLDEAKQDLATVTKERDAAVSKASKAVQAAAPSASPAAASAPAAAATDLADKSFSSAKPTLKDDGLGDFGGTARVTNTSDGEKTATFTYTLFKDGEQVGTLQGSAQSVRAGQTVTVQLISQDKFKTGVNRIEFQVDAEF